MAINYPGAKTAKPLFARSGAGAMPAPILKYSFFGA